VKQPASQPQSTVGATEDAANHQDDGVPPVVAPKKEKPAKPPRKKEDPTAPVITTPPQSSNAKPATLDKKPLAGPAWSKVTPAADKAQQKDILGEKKKKEKKTDS
jgi:hypothetical protein